MTPPLDAAAAGRPALRSAVGWRAYDRANLRIVGLLALAGVLWWAQHLAAPDVTGNIDGDLAPPADGPVRMRLSDSALDLRREGDRLVLRGQVRDDAARARLVQTAQAQFGAAAVDDRLALHPGADALAWGDAADAVFAALRRGADGDGLRVLGQAVTLEGAVDDPAARLQREAQARQWFGARFQIDNLIAVRESPAASVSVSAVVAPSAETPTVPAAASAAVPAASALAASPTAVSAADCAALANGVALRFRSGGEQLAAAGRARLDALAACFTPGRWRVGSPPDARDVAPSRDALAAARARAVADHLARRLAPQVQPAAMGVDATPAPPAEPASGAAPRDRWVVARPAD